MSAKGKLSVFAVAVVVVFAIVGAVWTTVAHSSSPPREAAPPIAVLVVKPQTGGVERTVTRPGSVYAFEFANLYAKVSGFLQNQTVDIGAHVKKDQLLAEIFAPELESDVQKAQADLQKAQAQTEVADARIAEAEAELKEAEAGLAQKQSDLESSQAMVRLRKEQHTRISNLAKANAVEQELVDEKLESQKAAEATASSSAKAVTTAEASVAAAKAHIKRAHADMADAKAQVVVAQASLSRAKTFQTYSRITSPYTGVVTRRSLHDGDFIREGMTGGSSPILTVARTDLMRVVTWVPDRFVSYTHAGARAVVHIDALDGHTVEGVVARTAESEDFNTRTMRTEIDLPNHDGRLSEGMYGDVTLFLGKTEHGLALPTTCLHGDSHQEKRSVYVVRDGKARELTVQVGIDDGIHAEILSGLPADAEVIERHGPGLTDGSPVKVVEHLSEHAPQKQVDDVYRSVD